MAYTQRRAPSQYATLEMLAQVQEIPSGDLYAICPKAKSGLAPLVEAGRRGYGGEGGSPPALRSGRVVRDSAPPLTEQQRAAAGRIAVAMEEESGRVFLLHGITGSGKTEVYLDAIGRTLNRGKGAIVLVPEISLTPQMVSRFRSRFGDTVAVIHSQLSVGERYDEWARIRRGEARVVIGARSAVFAPVEDIGLMDHR